jgi:hypothetical protein
MDADDIEIAAGWNANSCSEQCSEFYQAMLDFKFIDKTEEGIKIHDWIDHNEYASYAKERSEKAKNAAHTRWNNRNKPKGKQDVMLNDARSNAKRCSEQCPSPSHSPSLNRIKDTPIPPSNPQKEASEKYSLSFEDDWKDYPGSLKGSKEQGFKAWVKRKDKPDPKKLREIWKAQIEGKQSRKEAGEFVPEWPMFSVYFNQARWEEEFKATQKQPPPPDPISRDAPILCEQCSENPPVNNKFGRWLCRECFESELEKSEEGKKRFLETFGNKPLMRGMQ